ncbi:CoA pyrophosphatase [Lutibacter sp.]|uniref:NUDIX hydrolase n=1 Tax=Lutibacter sp. TaxID=1925666 RepID=UPI002732F8DE|nr:CoA pyrophosphatase [Lutibacter sp.]MDP3313547.1 CoA pyrophosphatase [Lutibacter sp.]
MIFSSFKKYLSKLIATPLLGENAQFKMVPKIRMMELKEKMTSKNSKKAAVLVLFYPNELGETCFLLTLRASYNGTHSDQISFPGGKKDLRDLNLEATALRETYEETGVQISDIHIFKQMTVVFIPPSNFLVSPFLGITNRRPNFIKNYEVEELIEVKLSDLLDETNVKYTTLSTSYAQNIEVPCFMLNNYVVWGATAMMLSEIKELIKLM